MIKNYIHQNPFIRFISPLIAGVIFKLIFPSVNFPFYIILCLYTLLFFNSFFYSLKYINYKYNWIFGILLYTLFFVIGSFLIQVNINKIERIPFSSSSNFYIGIVKEEPERKLNSYQTVVELQYFYKDSDWKKCDNKIKCFLEKDSLIKQLSIGDLIIFNSKIDTIKQPKNPKEFNYSKYLYHKGILCQSYISKDNYKILDSKVKYKLSYYATKIRNSLLLRLKEYGFKNDEYSTIAALSLGYKNDLRVKLRNDYAYSGAIHILAVSGLHIGIIYLLLSNILYFLQKNKFEIVIKGITIITLLWIYAFISGLSPSVVRATIMLTIIIIGKSLDRSLNIYNTIAASAFIILIINPFAITEVSFQLSYLAVIGIVFCHETINKKIWFNNKIINNIWIILTISVSAQLVTFPLTMYYFHQFPNYFFITNIIVIPLLSIIIYLAISFFSFSFIPFIAIVIGFILSNLVKLLNFIINFISELPYSHSENIYLQIWEVILLYLIIISFLTFLSLNKKILLKLSLLGIAILIFGHIIQTSRLHKPEIIVYSIKQSSAINLISKDNNILLTDSSLNTNNINFHIKNYWLYKGNPRSEIIQLSDSNLIQKITKVLGANSCYNIDNNYLINFYNKKIAILQNKNLEKFIITNPLKLDYLILSNNSIYNLKQLINLFECKKIILDSSFSKSKIHAIKAEAENLNIKIYSSNKQAYTCL